MHENFAPFEGVLFEESVLAISGVLSSGEGPVDFLGSAFIIAPHLAITAKHVIEGYLSKYVSPGLRVPNGYFVMPNDSHFRLVAWQGDGSTLLKRPFIIDQVGCSSFSDFAVLRLVPNFNMAGYIWRPYNLTTLLPDLGSTVTAFGYHLNTTINEGIEKYIGSRYFSHGQVEELHSLQRDASHINFPCFQTNARYDGGMSGGPVFSQSAYVVGIICASMPLPPDADNPAEQHYSHAAAMWPLLANTIEYAHPRLPVRPMTVSIQMLARVGIVRMPGYDDFTIKCDRQGFPTEIVYKRRK